MKDLSQLGCISDRCPTCGAQSLFIGRGGWLTCSVLGCARPSVTESIEKLRDDLDRCIVAGARANGAASTAREALEGILSLSSGRDEDGPLGPRPPFTWRTLGLVALDLAHAALAKLDQRTATPDSEAKELGGTDR